MGTPLKIEDLTNKIDDHTYVFMVGSIGSGKSHVLLEAISPLYTREEIRTKVFDIDMVMEDLGYTDYHSEQFSRAYDALKERMDITLKNLGTIFFMTTGSVVQYAVDRLLEAKLNGYKTIMFFVDAPLEDCKIQNQLRKEKGKRYVPNHQIGDIEKTYFGAQQTFTTLKETNLVDYYIRVDNSISNRKI